MNILITGSNGFLGRNLIEKLSKDKNINIVCFDKNDDVNQLFDYLKDCDFLYHFAAIHRPTDPMDFYRVNDVFFENIINKLEEYGNKCPILLTSSIQAIDSSDYGRSKVIAENLLKKHAERVGSRAIIYRLSNIFGKWATPNHHSVVATFCYNINRDIPIVISNRDIMMHFHYIDDVIDDFVKQLDSNDSSLDIKRIEKVYDITLGELADILLYFRECQKNNVKPILNNQLEERLYITYISYED